MFSEKFTRMGVSEYEWEWKRQRECDKARMSWASKVEHGNYLLLPSYPVAFQTIEYQVHLIAIIKWNLWTEICVYADFYELGGLSVRLNLFFFSLFSLFSIPLTVWKNFNNHFFFVQLIITVCCLVPPIYKNTKSILFVSSFSPLKLNTHTNIHII